MKSLYMRLILLRHPLSFNINFQVLFVYIQL